MKMNLGCGPDIKEGWLNVDNYYDPNNERPVWDMRDECLGEWVKGFDYVLVNHVFCTMRYDEVEIGLKNIYDLLKNGGVIEVIDMNPIKAFRAYERGDKTALPGFEGNIDDCFCKHLVGFGRQSMWTPYSMIDALERAGFKNALDYHKSEHDLRPKESFVIKAAK